jgi:predicted AlkP superfamily phosphohydrolase/phosphomutase
MLPGLVESRARFAAIDMRQTTVFSDELNYFPALHFNLEGREPLGTLDAKDRGRVLRDLEAFFERFCDPWSGERVVKTIWRREELFRGSALHRAPDLLLELAMPSGYSYNLMPSAGAPGTGAFRRLSQEELLGRKGRSLAGSHRPRGLFIGCGPSVSAVGPIDAAMADVSATVLARMGMSQLHRCDGRVLTEMLVAGESGHALDPEKNSTALPVRNAPQTDAPRTNADSGLAEARVEARLRRLGYIE